jgi:16S rRNA (cytosine1402-N4)-methyltransferase
MLLQSVSLIKKGGRFSVLTYHSLEDRIVKNFFKTGNFEGITQKDLYGNNIVPFKQINNKVIIPDDIEINQNSRARSAKLRIAEKL